MKLKRTIVAPALVAGVALVSGGWLLQHGVSEQRSIYEQARVFDEVMTLLSQRFVDRPSSGDLYRMATEGMIQELGDPHTTFLTPEEFNEFYTTMSGEYAGIGAQIVERDGWVTVLAPLPGTPAERAGLRAGDRMVEIAGRPTKGWTSDQAVKVLRGPRGEPVNIKIVRIGIEEPIPFTITREEIHLSSVPYAFMMGDGVGYANLSIFSGASSKELREAVQKLRGQGMRKLILDLRENPGGLLDQGVGVAEMFLKPGQAVVETRGRTASDNSVARARGGELAPEMPIVVLVDEYSASAAEIVAGALQDHDRALVLGARSFGKGSVQDLFPLSGGNFLKVTTSKWFTPVGRSIQKDLKKDGDPRAALATAGTVDEHGTPVPGAQADTTKPYRTASGRIVYGGGGIVPDVVVRPDTATAAEQEFFRAAAKGGSKFNDVLFRYAIEYGRANPGLRPDFPVTAEMRRELFERLRAAGLEITAEQYAGAREFIDRRLGQEVVQHKFGANAAAQRVTTNDRAVTEAFDLLKRADGPQALLRLVPPARQAPRAASAQTR
ncbi:MAG TPA: S41 family peptidase [Longimicrobiaceae bacterium]|nr:S41 family peptidase [Longimicrobiaceae bacterium]